MWHLVAERLNIVPSLEEAIKNINQMFLSKASKPDGISLEINKQGGQHKAEQITK